VNNKNYNYYYDYISNNNSNNSSSICNNNNNNNNNNSSSSSSNNNNNANSNNNNNFTASATNTTGTTSTSTNTTNNTTTSTTNNTNKPIPGTVTIAEVMKWKVKLFPRILDKFSKLFVYDHCTFSLQKSKVESLRMVAFLELGIDNAYTLEASLAGLSGDHFR
jgi:hypothetical protein